MSKRILTGLAVIALAALAVPALANHTFVDVPSSNVYHDDIAWLAETGVTRGCNPPENTEFCPDGIVTREQMAAFMHRLDDHVLEQVASSEPGSLALQLASANMGTAAYQDVPEAEKDGYVSTLETLGCHDNPGVGGMGLHYLNESLLDAQLDPTAPEALVYELDADGEIVGLVGLEYIVPIDAWTDSEPPELFGQAFTAHSELPIWKLHAWIWKDNPRGTFEDWNPKVRLCPSGMASES